MTPSAKDFQDLLEKDPYDSATRAMFADWLEENAHLDDSYNSLAAEMRRCATPEWCAARKRLEEFAEAMSEPDYDYDDEPRSIMSYDELMAGAAHYLETGDEHLLGYSTPDAGCNIDSLTQFWEDYRLVTNDQRPLPGPEPDADDSVSNRDPQTGEVYDWRKSFFRCAC